MNSWISSAPSPPNAPVQTVTDYLGANGIVVVVYDRVRI